MTLIYPIGSSVVTPQQCSIQMNAADHSAKVVRHRQQVLGQLAKVVKFHQVRVWEGFFADLPWLAEMAMLSANLYLPAQHSGGAVDYHTHLYGHTGFLCSNAPQIHLTVHCRYGPASKMLENKQKDKKTTLKWNIKQ